MYFLLEAIFFFVLSLVGIYFLWSRLREDLSEDLIFSLGLSIYGIAWIFFLGSYFYQSALFWIVGFGLLVAVYIQSRIKKVKFFETIDILTISALWCFFARTSVLLGFKRDLAELIFFIAVTFLIFVYYKLFSSYKRFTWYKSGRVGLAGILTLVTYFVGRILVAVFLPNVLSLGVNLEIIFSGILLTLSLFGLYRLNKV